MRMIKYWRRRHATACARKLAELRWRNAASAIGPRRRAADTMTGDMHCWHAAAARPWRSATSSLTLTHADREVAMPIFDFPSALATMTTLKQLAFAPARHCQRITKVRDTFTADATSALCIHFDIINFFEALLAIESRDTMTMPERKHRCAHLSMTRPFYYFTTADL